MAGPLPSPVDLFAPMLAALVQIGNAFKPPVAVGLPPWGGGSSPDGPPGPGGQGLSSGQLGVPPSYADGANYLATAMWNMTLYVLNHVYGGTQGGPLNNPAFSATPAGSTDPYQILLPIYVGMEDLAHVARTELPAAPWGASPTGPGSTPVDLALGGGFITGNLLQLAAFIAAGSPTGGTAPPPGAGIAPPIAPVVDPGPGIAGLMAAWDQWRETVNTTLPGLGNRVQTVLRTLGYVPGSPAAGAGGLGPGGLGSSPAPGSGSPIQTGPGGAAGPMGPQGPGS